ncbi:hypothetical protein PYW08_008808 [Mythimna loreyi]|uniref:Uncharacterized protein n=1 Tax=Mythimna loreyi TaxID=667449 RepID=A0ACC2QAP0_9NEOP|nr:hypothetical protein PYW08_008808 [Mythimna loreyi]
MKKLKCLMFGLLLSLFLCDGAKILVLFPVPSTSHGILGDNMVKHLLDGGHEVTYITPYVSKQPSHPKLRIIDVSDNRLYNDKMLNLKNIMSGAVNLKNNEVVFENLVNVAALTLENQNVQNLLKDRTYNFDVIIGEYMFTYLYSSLPAVLQCPFIWFSTTELHSMILDPMQGPLNPAYVSDYRVAQIAPYSFEVRVKMLWALLKELYQRNGKFYDKEEEIFMKLIAPIVKEHGRPVPNYNDLKYNASLLLENSQVAIGSAIPLPPNCKYIGGYHIPDSIQPLPEDLKKIMDNADNGVIYFSMGSILKSKDLPDGIKEGLLKLFGGLKQTVLWKFEDQLPGMPKNVHIMQWAPQQSILAHPNMVLFITHGGLLSLTEAVHFAVPVIVIPVFADQFLNANQAQRKGYAIKVDLTFYLHKDLKMALGKVLSDLPKYAERVKELSVAYHDKPMKPKDALNFWVNHVVKTKGAPHLKSVALQVPLYQRVYLDLIAVILVILIVLLKIFCLVTGKKSMKVKTN